MRHNIGYVFYIIYIIIDDDNPLVWEVTWLHLLLFECTPCTYFFKKEVYH